MEIVLVHIAVVEFHPRVWCVFATRLKNVADKPFSLVILGIMIYMGSLCRFRSFSEKIGLKPGFIGHCNACTSIQVLCHWQ